MNYPNIGSLSYGQIKRPAGELEISKAAPFIALQSYGDLFEGALSLKIGDGTKRTMTKNAAESEGRWAAHTYA